MPKSTISNYISKYRWLIFLFIGAISFLLTWLTFPQQREEHSLIQYVIQIAIFVIILLGISFFPNRFRFRYLLLSIPFVIYLSFFAPRMTYLALERELGVFYTLEFTFLYPGIVMAICLAYRMGGGSPGNCLKTGLNGIVLLFSGFLDLMWFVVNQIDYTKNVDTIPHIQTIIGHVPSFTELIIFIIIHVIIIVFINCLPLDKWMSEP
jgi:hypothetical protein